MTRHVDATVAEAVGEARSPGIAEHSVTTALVPRERVQQRTVELVEDTPQSPEETVEAVTLVPRERVQQRTAARSADKARPPGIGKKSATTKSDIAVSSDKARPARIKKGSAATDSEMAVFLGEAGPSRPRAGGSSAVDTAVATIADEARPPEIAKRSATTESDIAGSIGEAGPRGPERMTWTVPPSQQPQSLLVKLDLQGLRSRIPSCRSAPDLMPGKRR